ncbi:hypothetical protein ISF_04661 [Cordyceps fumosorosea ARSEF 2679]|uniref:Uncharacterized protein n=1 Tax=Cordyceps fumosorosea (strain ARSEF 2679) TaxID=1081104 RepID=A0A162J5C1_CORFA|nr:hypothetical protein ISF_04661 [Cordyceps fumosorosea ARSEF 2679]OAA63952.1 hypothetical protein ISF_04661 [Cordyceps fumosorosea ARSEF 2679]
MDWFLDAKGLSSPRVDPLSSTQLLGQLVIGELPADVTPEAVHALFETVPLPVKKTHPQQSCVTWVLDAVERLQERGWARLFDVEKTKEDALAYADNRNWPSTEPEIKHYGLSADEAQTTVV